MRSLKPSEETYRILYEDNPSMYFAVGADGVVLSVNHYGASNLGYRADELLGTSVTGVFHPEDREAVQKQLATCCANPGQVFEWELRKVHRDGHVMWVQEQARAAQDSAGDTIVLIVCEDITSRRDVEEQLRQARDEMEQRVSDRTDELRRSRERYRDLLESVQAIPWESHSDAQGHSYVGPQAVDILGYPRERWYEEGFWVGIVHADDRQRAQDFYNQVTTTTSGGAIEYRMVAVDGRIVWVRDVVSVTHQGGGPTVSRGFMIDITQRKMAEDQVEEQRAFLRQVIDVDPNFIFAKDRAGRFTLVNQAVADAYGTTVEELIGKTDADFNSNPEEVEAFRQRDLEVMDTQQEMFIPEETLTDAEGKVRWLQTVKRPIIGDDGVADQVLGSVTDITSRKKVEAQLRESEAALRVSQQRLRDLAGRLLSAQEEERRRLAREIHDDLSQRLAGLASKAGYLEQALLRQEALEPPQLAEIHSELIKLATDVRTLSRGLHPSMLEHLGLEDALRWECQNFSKRGSIEVRFSSREVPEQVSMDLGICLYRITQAALHNVELHAGTDTASVSLIGAGETLELAIEDRGRGFDPARSGVSEGIGLASMEERVRLAHGEIEFDAAPGRGTRIVVRVPLRSVDMPAVGSTLQEEG
jgi:PAS domain S-box-containing protein